MNRYLYLKAKLLARLLAKGKISFTKISNYLSNLAHYAVKSRKAGKLPSFLIFETATACNMFCATCRDENGNFGKLSNLDGKKLRHGAMGFDLFKRAIDEAKGCAMLATMYVSGEPLMNPKIYDMISYATKKKVPTLISTNGMLLGEENSAKLLKSGIDIIKVAVSGFTQKTYSQLHRGGDIEKVKHNLRLLSRLRNKIDPSAIIMVDYILFEHNKQEAAAFRRFANKLGIVFNLRLGRTVKGTQLVAVKGKELKPSRKTCEWLWFISTIHWTGKIYPCCEMSCYEYEQPLGNIETGLKNSWNNSRYCNLRKLSARLDYRNLPQWCKNCHYEGIGFQG